MAELKYFTPVLTWLSVVADAPQATGGDADANPDSRGMYGGVTVTPSLTDADVRAIRATALTPAPALIVLAPIEARLDEGRLMLTAEQRLRLVAQCPALELEPGVELRYSFRFHDVKYNGADQLLPTITVAAPEIAEDHDDDLGGPGANEIELDLVSAPWL